MSNMSYCRFENTSLDLEDCVYAMEDAESLEDMDLSSEERYAAYRMYDLAKSFIEEYERLNAE